MGVTLRFTLLLRRCRILGFQEVLGRFVVKSYYRVW